MSQKLLVKCLGISLLLVLIGIYAVPTAVADAPSFIFICHYEPNGNLQVLEVPPQAMNGHFDAQGNPLHAGDHLSPDGNCGEAGTPTPTPGDDPDPVPEPVSMLLFGAGVAGVGYAVRKLRGKGQKSDE